MTDGSLPSRANRDGGPGARRLGSAVGRLTGDTAPSAGTVLGVLALLTAVAIVYRGQWIGNPLPYEDEQFYLLTANRLWQGDWPYVDIWDRKPIGLFLLYAAFVPFGDHGLVAYQVGALLFTVATAFVIVRIASRVATIPAGVAGSLLYIINLQVFGGRGGQSPVFYNLLMASAALLSLRVTERSDPRSVAGPAIVAMSLVGLAIQIKYTAFVEGIFFGLVLSRGFWTRARNVLRTALFMAMLVAAALLPTAVAFTVYALHGYASQFAQANFVSIFQTVDPKNGAGVTNLLRDLGALIPFGSVAAFGLIVLFFRRPLHPATTFIVGWLLFALIGFVVIGRFYAHYLIPSLVPMAILAAPCLVDLVSRGVILAFFVAATGQAEIVDARETMTKYRRYISAMTEVLQPYASYGCLYLRDGPSMIYVQTRSCLPSPYVFPDHLSKLMESRATDAARSMERLLASRPAAISISTRSTTYPPNAETAAMLSEALRTRYRLKADITEGRGDGHQLVYVRSDLP